MEGWSNEQVIDWLNPKYTKWNQYFKNKGINGRALVYLTIEELLEAKIDKSIAKRIIAKRDRTLKKQGSYTYVNILFIMIII